MSDERQKLLKTLLSKIIPPGSLMFSRGTDRLNDLSLEQLERCLDFIMENHPRHQSISWAHINRWIEKNIPEEIEVAITKEVIKPLPSAMESATQKLDQENKHLKLEVTRLTKELKDTYEFFECQQKKITELEVLRKNPISTVAPAVKNIFNEEELLRKQLNQAKNDNQQLLKVVKSLQEEKLIFTSTINKINQDHQKEIELLNQKILNAPIIQSIPYRPKQKNISPSENFPIRARKRHGNLYDYSKSKYTSDWHEVEIICRIHGSFMQYPSNHIWQLHGCPECGKTKCVQTRLSAKRDDLSDEKSSILELIDLRWPNGVECPYKGCDGGKIWKLNNGVDFKCSYCLRRFSYKTGSLLDNSKLPASVWLAAISLWQKNKNISSIEMAKLLAVTQQTAWRIIKLLNENKTPSL